MDGFIELVTFGPVWDRMINLITEHKYRPVPKLIIGPIKWNAVLRSASEEDRATLKALEASGQVIVSSHLPDPEVAYRFTAVEEP
jgi:hypothetical protein